MLCSLTSLPPSSFCSWPVRCRSWKPSYTFLLPFQIVTWSTLMKSSIHVLWSQKKSLTPWSKLGYMGGGGEGRWAFIHLFRHLNKHINIEYKSSYLKDKILGQGLQRIAGKYESISSGMPGSLLQKSFHPHSWSYLVVIWKFIPLVGDLKEQNICILSPG